MFRPKSAQNGDDSPPSESLLSGRIWYLLALRARKRLLAVNVNGLD
jgi:hypothetical protein